MSHPARVLLVGLGNIGFRHLQGMAPIAPTLQLSAVDPAVPARERAEAEWAAAGGSGARFLGGLGEVGAADVAILATSAAGRLGLMRSTLEVSGAPLLVLEKVVFQNPADFPEAARVAGEAGARVWVNCPRRLWPAYQALAERLRGEAFTLQVRGRNIGLACNGVHFIDLLQFLSGEAEVTARSTAIDAVIPSKREGYFECLGRLTFATPSGAVLELTVDADSPERTEVEIVRADGSRLRVDDATGVVTGLDGEDARDFGRSPYQSELTGGVVRDLLERGDCGLASLAESEAAHRPFLEALRPAFEARGIAVSAGLPIT